jgi:hypothetical protein
MPLPLKVPPISKSQIEPPLRASGSRALAIDILEEPQSPKVWHFPHYAPNLKSQI